MAVRFTPFHKGLRQSRKGGINLDLLQRRVKYYVYLLLAICLAIGLRLAYWQIWQHKTLLIAAEDQYRRTLFLKGNRGSIYTSDGFVLATNEPRFKLFAQPNRITTDPLVLAQQICPVIESRPASDSAQIDCEEIQIKLSQRDKPWSYLVPDLTFQEKSALATIKDPGIGFEEYQTRVYPEASMAAQLLGFVGKDEYGTDVGYFGVEGLLEKELRGTQDSKTVLTDALGYQLSGEGFRAQSDLQGRDIVLTIRRDIQAMTERYLAAAMNTYGAESGEVIVMEPTTGKILALANNPTFIPSNYANTDSSYYRNRSLVDVYEPGSTFKVLTVSAGIDKHVIAPDTACTSCSGPRVFGQYTIRTWNNQYQPNITMTQALEKSDNTAMIFAAERLGADSLRSYLQKFGIGQPIGIDLQGDNATPFPSRWGPVEMATISFGQGVGTTSLQLMRAVATIANHGKLVSPQIVEAIKNGDASEALSKVDSDQQVISSESANTVTSMMISAAEHGEAKWVYAKNFRVAGKTGTSQVAVGGGYDENKTIASFIGFSPPENPKFVMMVKLVAPTSSPWAAETAAPLWFKIANRLYLLLHIPYDDAGSSLPTTADFQ